MNRHRNHRTGRFVARAVGLSILLWFLILGVSQGSGIVPTNQWVDFYSQNSTYLGQPVPVGAYVAIFDAQGVQCGEYTVMTAGQIAVTPCYGDDPSTPEDEGAQVGDVLTFKINGRTAHTEAISVNDVGVPANTIVTWNYPADIIWNLNLHVLFDAQVDLQSSTNPSVFGQPVTFTATVSAVPPGTSTPSGTVTFKDGATALGTAGLTGGVATFTTSDLAAGPHIITAEYSGDANFNASTGNLTQEVRTYEQRCGLTAAAYDFNASGPVRVDIAVLGTLDCLQVERVVGNHPQATAGIATGQYWLITGTDSLGGTAGRFSVTLTLPTSFVPDGNDKLCRYTGTAQVWDCVASGFDAVNQTVTRAGVTQFSDWAVGHHVGPTTVTLGGLRASSRGPWSGIGLLFGGLLGLAAAGILLYSRARRT